MQHRPANPIKQDIICFPRNRLFFSQGVTMSVAGTSLTPAIPNFSAGREFISRIPLSNQQLAFAELSRFLDGLLSSTLNVKTVFQLLELVRPPIAFIAEELAKSYLNKPVPMADMEEGFFRQVIQLLQKTAKCYEHCSEKGSLGISREDRALLAAILHRCIHFTGLTILEHQHARRELLWGLWLKLHEYYEKAEKLELALQEVPDVLEPHAQKGKTSCTAAYVAFILCDMSGGFSLSLQEQKMVRRWALSWSPLVSLHAIALGETLPQYVIDLTYDAALRPTAESLNTTQLRRLGTVRLASQISQIGLQLKQRVRPVELGLGEDCSPQQCTRMLAYLASQWSQARAARKYRRHPSTGMVRVCTGFEEMHFFISGSEFQQPESARVYSRQDFDQLYAFRFQENPGQALYINREKLSATYRVDTWEMVNQSANGFRLIRSVSGRKMVHGQLLALCPHDSQRFLLAQTVWLMQEHKGGLIAGIKALPGLPTAICARTTEQRGEPYQRAFLLASPKSVQMEQSLILPPGWYRPGRIIEIFDKNAQSVQLKGLLDSGPGFERFKFEPC